MLVWLGEWDGMGLGMVKCEYGIVCVFVVLRWKGAAEGAGRKRGSRQSQVPW